MKIVIASNNTHKIKEIRAMFQGLDCEVLSYVDILGYPVDVIEDGETFCENAIKKLIDLPQPEQYFCLADDSGLEVEALDGAPGINSARYAGEGATTEQLCRKLLQEMQGKVGRNARFTTVIALQLPNQTVDIVSGHIKGIITEQMRGTEGFGYDSVFQPNGYDRTFAEMAPHEKNCISHRYIALENTKKRIAEFLNSH